MTANPLDPGSAEAAEKESPYNSKLVELTEKGAWPNEATLREPASKSTKWDPVEEVKADSHVWFEDGNFWEKMKDQLDRPPRDEEVDRLASEIEGKLKIGLLAFDQFGKSPTKKFIQIEDRDKDIWFVGDLHGDWLGLESAVHYVDHFDRRNDARSVITFLGDLFDRGNGEHGAKVLFRVLSLINERPGRIGFVVGNHDNELKAADDKFTSGVYPGEFADWLNEKANGSPWRKLAKVAIRFFKDAPRALLLPDGLLVAHGGVPHTDLQNAIQSPADFDNEEMLEDFVWTRLHERAKVRRPNRTTRGCSLGIDDFNHFCERAGEVLDREILGMLRGHDHLEERFRLFEKYEKYRVLTINTICHRLDGEMLGSFERPAIIAKWDPSKMPTVHRLEIPKEIVAEIYGSGSSERD